VHKSTAKDVNNTDIDKIDVHGKIGNDKISKIGNSSNSSNRTL
jgi:hypothetical protein